MSIKVQGQSGGVTSLINSDGTLTISPTTGAVVASLALGHANTWTAIQTFSNSTYSALFTGGNVGIGTAIPGYKLDVNGDINIVAGSAYKYDGFNVIRAQTSLNNYFFGGAGNLTNTSSGVGDSVGIGYQSLVALTTGYRNNSVGSYALKSNTTGFENEAMGFEALTSNTTGYANVAIGEQSLRLNISGNENAAIGNFALYSNTTGNDNVAVGSIAMYGNTTGSGNFGLGQSALYNNTTGSSNVAIGLNSLSDGTAMSRNIGIGYQALKQNTADNNVAIGYQSLFSNTSATGNTAIGYQSTYANTTGTLNTAVGGVSLSSNTTGGANTVLGYNAGHANTTGDGNTALGAFAFEGNTTGIQNTAVGVAALSAGGATGNYNTAFGVGALRQNTSGQGNAAQGYYAVANNTTGASNLGIGNQSLFNNNTGSNNIAVGEAALYYATGSQNVALGYGAGFRETGSNSFYVGNVLQANTADDKAYSLLYGVFSGTAGSLTGQQLTINGNVGIGNTAPSDLLDIGVAGTTLGVIRLEGNTSGYTRIAPAAAAGSWTLTLPTSAGTSGYVLSTDGSGNTSWSSKTALKIAAPLFDHYADVNNSGTSETDLYTDTLAAGQLANNGDKVLANYQIVCNGAALASQDMKIYFGGTVIYDTGALSIGAITSNFTFSVLIIRESSSVVRCETEASTDFATLFPYSTYTRVTGLTLSNSQVLKITGTAAGAGGASNQITSKLGTVNFNPAA